MDGVTLHARARFAEPGVVRQGWYNLVRARRLRPGKPLAVPLGDRRLVLWRDAQGRPHAADDRCPHLGADLSLGAITPEGLRCGFHGWCFDAAGACVRAPGATTLPPRRLRTYRVEERDGFLWAWVGGGEPGFPLPEVPPGFGHRLVLRAQRVRGHMDVIFSNSFDFTHFGPSHGMDARTLAVETVGPWRMSHHVEGTLPQRPTFRMVGVGGKPWEAIITQHGGATVHIRFRRPVEFVVAFHMRPEGGSNRTRTMVFLKRRRDAPKALSLLWTIVLDDLRLMETMRWTGAFAEGDDVLRQYARFAEAMPTW